jgi:hypothetical protein
MIDRRLRYVLASGVVVAAAVLGPTVATAATPFVRGFSDPIYTSESGAERAQWFDQSAAVGTNVARIDLAWRAVSRNVRPADPTNPADPSYDFDAIDRAVREAGARGMSVLLTIQSAPDWAVGPNENATWGVGAWKPNPQMFRDFVEAVTTRYSGSYSPDPLQGPLPEVDYIEPWNEPNLPQFLSPQWKGKKQDRPASPDLYRKMLNAAYGAAHAVNPEIKIVGGATAPFGDDPGDGPRIRPLQFLRELLCLRKRDGELKRTRCKQEAKLDVLSHHPIHTAGGPTRSAISPDDAAVADFHNVVEVLRAAERTGTVRPNGRRPAWGTETWWETDPDPGGFPQEKVARWIPEMLYSLREQGAQAVIWLLIVDKELSPNGGGFQSGLYNVDGTPKPLVETWRFPFFTERLSRRSVRAWSIPPGSGKLAVEERRGSGWKKIATMNATARRPVQKTVKISGAAELRATLNGESSRSSKAKSTKAAKRAGVRSGTSEVRDGQRRGAIDPLLNPYVEAP